MQSRVVPRVELRIVGNNNKLVYLTSRIAAFGYMQHYLLHYISIVLLRTKLALLIQCTQSLQLLKGIKWNICRQIGFLCFLFNFNFVLCAPHMSNTLNQIPVHKT